MDYQSIKRETKADIRSICNTHGLINPLDLQGMSYSSISNYVPSVIENTPRGERSFDLFSRLLRERIVFLTSEVNDIVASIFVGQLLLLDSEDSSKDVYMYINSPGGSVTAGLAMYDTMQHIGPDVATFCMGQCASMGAFLLSSGTKGKRMALPNSRVLIHQPLGGAQGQASDIKIQADEILRMKKLLNDILAANCNQDIDKVTRDTDRDYIMTANDAKEYGLVDRVVAKKPANINPES
jgi:ATP-dependent Clp protease, protease subunit